MRAVTRGCASADDCYLCQCKAIETLGLTWLAALLWHHPYQYMACCGGGAP